MLHAADSSAGTCTLEATTAWQQSSGNRPPEWAAAAPHVAFHLRVQGWALFTPPCIEQHSHTLTPWARRLAQLQVGEVLVERTVGEVLPAVKTNRDNLAAVRGTHLDLAQWRSRMAVADFVIAMALFWAASPARGSHDCRIPSHPPLLPPPPAGGQL